MRRSELSTRTLVRYLQGELTRSESEEVERQVADSRRAQERVAELRAIMDELRRPPEWVDAVDLVPALNEHLAREGTPGAERAGPRPGAARRRAARWLGGGAGAALMAAAAIVLVARAVEREPETEQPTKEASRAPDRAGRAAGSDLPIGIRRKGVVRPGDPDRWVGIELALARAGATPEVVAANARLAPGELSVTYTNLGPEPFSYLMVFAVDAAGEVRWLYPAYEREGTDPAAVAIASGVAHAPLPDLIEHDFPAGRLLVCGLFLRAPLAVSRVEAALGRRQPAAGERLPFPDAGQHCFDVEVP
jgi:anti-sigma factor RsiW